MFPLQTLNYCCCLQQLSASPNMSHLIHQVSVSSQQGSPSRRQMAGRYWFDQVGGRAGSALDEPMKYESEHEISSSMALGNVNKSKIGKVRDSRVWEEVKSWWVMWECESEHTWGSSRMQLGQALFDTHAKFLYKLCYNLSVIIGAFISHERGGVQSLEIHYKICEPTETFTKNRSISTKSR